MSTRAEILNTGETTYVRNGVNPKKFLMWLIMVSVVMLFGALTSAVVVRQADGGWMNYEIPQVFTISTVVILISSVTTHLGLRQLKKGNFEMFKNLQFVSLGLGIIFLVTQYIGWTQLPLDLGGDNSNPSVSFFYVLSGAHGAHIITGLAFIAYTLGSVKVGNYQEKRSVTRVENSALFWHFLDGLWLYLFIFLSLTK